MAKAETKKRIQVGSGTTPDEVVAADAKGATLVFDYEEEFLALSDATVEKLSHENQKQWFIAKGAHGAWAKQRGPEGPTPGLKILDPLGGNAGNKLKVLQRGKDGRLRDVRGGWTDATGKKWHPCWKRPDELDEALEMGYTKLSKGSDPDILTRGATATSESRVIRRRDGTDDLVALKVPDEIFQEHLQAGAAISARNSGVPFKELKEKLKGIAHGIEIEDTSKDVVATYSAAGEVMKE